MIYCFHVPGVPAPGGSKKAFVIKKGPNAGRAVLTDAGGAKNRDWRNSVKLVARENCPGKLEDGPIALFVEFVMPRPKYHYRTNGELGPRAEEYHTKAPDTTKLLRSTEDALTDARIWGDDAQVAIQAASKVYGEEVGANISIYSGRDFAKCPALSNTPAE